MTHKQKVNEMQIKTWVINKIDFNEFTWEEFLEILFPKHEKTREAANKILLSLKEKPSTLNEIITTRKIARGTAYDAFDILRKAGLIDRKDKYSELTLSHQFSLALERLSKYWKNWSKQQ